MSEQKNSARFLVTLFFPFALGYFVSYLFRTVNAVIAPDLTAEIGLSAADLGLLTATYFLTFAACQLPLGILLDHFGPRRVESVLLLLAAAGALLFSQATSLAGLIAGRALIGVGVSACLMAAFKAFAAWLPASRLPLANGIQMVSGGLGALAATTPVQGALQVTDWRGVFTGLAVIALLAALVVFMVVPEPRREGTAESFTSQIAGLKTVLGSSSFWRITPWAVTAQAAYLSIQGLWSGPWLRDVAGLERDAVAAMLFWVAIAMMCGYFALGSLAERLARRGIRTSSIATVGMLLFMGIQLLLVIAPGYATILWLGFGFFGTANILAYALLSQIFPSSLTGRANTALNLLVFVAAFGGQWLIGAIVGTWPVTKAGHYAEGGYQAAFLVLILCQVVTAGWYYFKREA